jgi:hypothetical protein
MTCCSKTVTGQNNINESSRIFVGDKIGSGKQATFKHPTTSEIQQDVCSVRRFEMIQQPVIHCSEQKDKIVILTAPSKSAGSVSMFAAIAGSTK